MRRFGEISLAFVEVCVMCSVALVGLCFLPFYSLWTWWIGDPWWAVPKGRPAKGFWRQP